MMAEIYKTAIGVISWLGEGSADTDIAMHSAIQSQFSTQVSNEELYRFFAMILSVPYWSRVWTLQERLLAKKFYVLCGDQIVFWSKLKERYIQVRKIQTEIQTSQQNFYGFDVGPKTEIYPELLTDSLDNKGWRLFEVVSTFRTLRCTDPRDKVYGLRALAINGNELSVNYSQPSLQIFFKLLFFARPDMESNGWTKAYLVKGYGKLFKGAKSWFRHLPITNPGCSSIFNI